MGQGRAQGVSLIDAQRDPDDVLCVGKQLRNRPAEQQGNHGARAAVVIQAEFHELGFGNGDAVYGVPAILLQPCRSDEIQRVGHLLVSPGQRQIGPVRHRVIPFFRRDFIPDQADALGFQPHAVPLGAIIIKQRPHHFIGARSVRHAVEHVQYDPVILPAKRDHMVIGIRRIQRHAMQRRRDHHGPMVFRKDVLAVLFPQFHAEIRVSFHGGIHRAAKDSRVDQIPHADPDPDLVGAFLAGHIERAQL